MASGNFHGRKSPSNRKRRPKPGLVLIGVLSLAATVVWLRALTSSADIDDAVRCEPEATPPPGVVFTPLDYDALDDATPVPPNRIAVRVLNAGDGRGAASITTESLKDLGFTEVGEPANDPAYPKGNANCQGQIRFGDNGTSAARTVSLVVPCAQLVKDNRADSSVDLAIGNAFDDLHPNRAGREVLQRLTDWAARHPGGEEQSGGDSPVIDPKLLEAARDYPC